MNNQKSKKIFIIATLTILGIGLFLFTPVLAKANGLVDVIFEQEPLFNEANFLPGQEVTRWVEVTNKNTEVQPIGIEGIDNSSCSKNCLSDQLQLVINNGTTELYNASLTEFFGDGEIPLSDLGPGNTIRYYLSVTFLPESNNDYQNSIVNFDFNIGTLGTESIGEEVPPGGGGGGGIFVPGLTISNENTTGTQETEVTITWFTNMPATSRVIYSKEDQPRTLKLDEPFNYGYFYSTGENPSKVTFHTVTISGLEAGKVYYYRCVSHGSLAVSKEHSFTTLVLGEEEEEFYEEEENKKENEPKEENKENATGTEETERPEETTPITPPLEGAEGEEGLVGLEGGATETEEIAEEETKKGTVALEEEPKGFNKLLAGIGGFFSDFNWQTILFFLGLILILLLIIFFLNRKKKKEEKEKRKNIKF